MLVELLVRLPIILACLLLGAPATATPRQQLDTLTPAQAISRAAAASPKPIRALFEFKVQSAKGEHGGYYLDSERDYRSAANLAVAIKASAMPGLTQKYGQDLKAAFLGKTLKIIGEVRRIAVGKTKTATATQVEVTHAGQILSVS